MSEYIPDRMTDGGPYGDRADGCGRLGTVGQRRANTVKREPLLRIQEN